MGKASPFSKTQCPAEIPPEPAFRICLGLGSGMLCRPPNGFRGLFPALGIHVFISAGGEGSVFHAFYIVIGEQVGSAEYQRADTAVLVQEDILNLFDQGDLLRFI